MAIYIHSCIICHDEFAGANEPIEVCPVCEDRITCNTCGCAGDCAFARDPYNIDGDCLASK